MDGIERFKLGHEIRRARMLEHFDADNDGKLNKDERQEAAAFRREKIEEFKALVKARRADEADEPDQVAGEDDPIADDAVAVADELLPEYGVEPRGERGGVIKRIMEKLEPYLLDDVSPKDVLADKLAEYNINPDNYNLTGYEVKIILGFILLNIEEDTASTEEEKASAIVEKLERHGNKQSNPFGL